MEALTAKLLEMGVRVDEGIGEDSIRVRSDGRHRRVNIKTQPYPGFPTDLQQPISVLLSTAKGTSIIHETIFEMRFKHLDEIRRMGGISQGQRPLRHHRRRAQAHGLPVKATDLRAGAAMVVAGLMAEGQTDIYNVHYIDRGYEHLEQKAQAPRGQDREADGGRGGLSSWTGPTRAGAIHLAEKRARALFFVCRTRLAGQAVQEEANAALAALNG